MNVLQSKLIGAVLVFLSVIFCLPDEAMSQLASARADQSLNLDAAPSPESGAPDPLAPKQADGPAPLAPGAPAAVKEPSPSHDVDAVVALVRQHLATATAPRGVGAREDFAAVVAYYASQPEPIWTGQTGFTVKGQQVINEISRADDWGLKASAFELPKLPDASPTLDALAEAEATLALAVVKYARHARGGRLEPLSVSRKFDQQPVIYDPKSVLEAIALADAADAYLQGLHPHHPQFDRLRRALIAQRAASAAANAPSKDGPLRLQLLIVNMERWRWMPPDLGSFYVWNSIPDQMTKVVEDGKVLMSEKIVVGKLSSPTPVFSAPMQFVIFHPSWGVPPGMKTNELAPKLRDTGGGWFSSKPLASEVLRAQGLQVTRGGSPINPDSVEWANADIGNYEFTQGPGPANVLGAVKFRFPNKHDVYMHDTPEKHLFGGAVRAFSHGCMRVQNPMHLAAVLLTHDKGWSAEKIKEVARQGSEVTLTVPVPVHVTYFTATVDDAGTLVTRLDIYGLDSRVASALESREVQVVTTKSVPSEPAAAAGQVWRQKSKVRQRSAVARQQPAGAFNPFEGLFGE